MQIILENLPLKRLNSIYLVNFSLYYLINQFLKTMFNVSVQKFDYNEKKSTRRCNFQNFNYEVNLHRCQEYKFLTVRKITHNLFNFRLLQHMLNTVHCSQFF